MKYRIFISSVQDEFAAERRKLKDWLGSDSFISRFVESVFLFEDVPAKGRSPVFEYHGSAFVVTILKDAWTRTALESFDLNPDQIKAVSYVKVNGWISSSRYAELYKVPMRTSSRELGELAHKGVFVLVGKGRQSRYELKSNRARIAPIAPNAEQSAKSLKIKGETKVNLGLSPQTSKEAAQETAQETAQENLSAEESRIVAYIKANAATTRKLLSEKLGISSDSVKRRLEALKAKLGLHHEGPTKKGRWVFGPKPKGKRGAK